VKFLVDVYVGRRFAEWLRKQGNDIRGVREFSPSMDDDEIPRLAHIERRIVIIMDRDFGNQGY